MRGTRRTRAWLRREAVALGILALALAGLAAGWTYAVNGAAALGLGAFALASAALVARAGLGALAWAATGAVLVGLEPPGWVTSLPVVRGCVMNIVTFAKRTLNDDDLAVVEMLARARPDVAFVQESLDPDRLAALALARPEFAGFAAHTRPEATLLILSRWPLEAPAVPPPPGVLEGVARVGGQPLRLVTTLAPKPGDPARDPFFAALRAHLAGETALILGADLNAGPASPSVAALTARLTDAFARGGEGFGFTFPAPGRRLGSFGAFARLDYILLSPQFATRQVEVLRTNAGSSHFPVKATVGYSGGGRSGEGCAG